MAGKIQDKKIKKLGHLYKTEMFIGAVSTNWTLLDQYEKIKEELEEVYDAFLKYSGYYDNNNIEQIGAKWDILEETCDLITASFTLLHMLGFNHYDLEDMMIHVVNKNIDRGYLNLEEEPE